MSDRTTLKSYFETGDTPTEAEFADLIDSAALTTETITTAQANDITANNAKNSYPSADATKLAGIETGAEVNTVDSVNGEVGVVVLNTDDISEGSTNEYFTDAKVSANLDVVTNTAKNSYPSADATKLSGIEAGAEVNDTAAEIKTKYESNANTNAFTDAEKTNLGNQSGTNTGDQDISGIATNATNITTIQGEQTTQDAAIALNTAKNSYPSADATKLSGIEAGAEVNTVDSVNGETGAVALDTDDIAEGTTNLYYTDSRVSNNTDVTANTAKNSYPNADADKVSYIELETTNAADKILQTNGLSPKDSVLLKKDGQITGSSALKYTSNGLELLGALALVDNLGNILGQLRRIGTDTELTAEGANVLKLKATVGSIELDSPETTFTGAILPNFTTSNSISFTRVQEHGTYTAPISSATINQTNAKRGQIQRAYITGAWTIPASCKNIGVIEYDPAVVNFVLFQYSESNRIEYIVYNENGLPSSGPNVQAPLEPTANADYTLTLSDPEDIRMNSVSGNNVIIPTNASEAIPVGTKKYIEQKGAGTIEATAAVGVTINTTANKTPYQYGYITLHKVGTDVWNVIGGTV